MTRTKNRGLLYIRRSTDKQEISLIAQVEWGIAAASQHGVALDATVADLDYMQAHGLHRYKDIFLDDGISGRDLSRPGFLAVNRVALEDRSRSHVFIYKRDRFARPADAMPMAQVEKQLLESGITVVFSDTVSLPYPRGEGGLTRDIELLFGYYQGGEELRKHAERVVSFQRKLAEGGYRVGGNPPYGFVRVLVDGTGKVLEELPPGKTVQQAGCHVRAVPKDAEKIAVWLRILAWKAQGWGTKKIAQKLNALGIPSPDAGRTRTDHGVKHRVSGKWNHNTVGELCRNPLILGIQEYGKRSEGVIRRLGKDGPRLLEEKDRTEAGGVRVVFNDPSLRTARQVGEPQFDPEQWQAIQRQMDERGRDQRSIARAKDPARYPLACRLVDLTDGCGSILYGRTTHGRAVYICGRYMRTSGAECASNQVDAEAMLRFALKTLKQLVDRHGNRDKLRRKLLERARREAEGPAANPREVELARLRERRDDLGVQQETIAYRMARERSDTLYAALSTQYQGALAGLAVVEEAIRRMEAAQTSAQGQTPEQQAEAVLGLLDDILRITTNQVARAEVNPLMQKLGVRIGLTFGSAIKGKKRVVRRLLSGRMVCGDAPLPVPLFGKDNVDGAPIGGASPTLTCDEVQRDQGRSSNGEPNMGTAASDVIVENSRDEKQTAVAGVCPATAAAVGDWSPLRLNESQPEGVSITKMSRGERI